MKLLASLWAIGLAQLAMAADKPGPVNVPPTHSADNLVTRWQEPFFPDDALKAGVTGEVEIEFDVNQNGRLIDPKVVQSRPSGVFDEAVLLTLNKWTVLPYRASRCIRHFPRTRVKVSFLIEDGKPSVVRSPLVPLSEPIADDAADIASSAPKLESAPVLKEEPALRFKGNKQPRYPRLSRDQDPIYGDVFANIHIGTSGKVEKVDILFSAPYADFGDAVVEAVSTWEAKTVNGDPPGSPRTLCVPWRFRPKA